MGFAVSKLSYITNGTGKVSQHMEYMPFGETLVDEHLNSYNSPFKFNGKEFDEETGNYYYSARYFDPKWSIFISVDPLAEKYPNWSSYAYCFNNPVRMIDPTGMEAEPPTELFDLKGKKIGQDANGNDGNVSIIKNEAKAKEIEKNYKKGEVASSEDVNSGVKTTKAVLNETLDVLNRTRKNGGDKEEISTVTAIGEINRAATGKPDEVNGRIHSESITVPEGTGNTSIHSHILTITLMKDGRYKFGDAGIPSDGTDDYTMFTYYSMNIIVGYLGEPTIRRDQLGNDTVSKPSVGAVFFNSNATEVLRLTEKAIENIVKK